jgi:peptide/nickel transport system substrate-binding protein
MRRVLGLVTVLLLVSCSAIVGGPSTAERHPWTKPGILRIASISDPDTLSPLIGNFQIDFDLAMFWGGFLFNYDDRDRLVPELATDEPTTANGGISRDGKTIVYHLRQGVKWHDGVPFDADDVIFTWHAIMNPKNNVGIRVGYDRITTIDKRDDHTIAVHLAGPYAPFVGTFLTQSAIPIPVYPRHLLEKFADLNQNPYNSKPIGTGPFKVQEWHRGSVIRMVANDDYWRGKPKLREVDYQAIPTENTILTSLRAHDVDLWFNASSSNVPAMKGIEHIDVHLVPFVQFGMLALNSARPITSDLRVRRALQLGLDRKRIVDQITYGVNQVGEGDQPKAIWAHDARLPLVAFDPARARALLDAAGWVPGPGGVRVKDGTPLALTMVFSAGDAIANRLAVITQSQWRAIGVDLSVKPYATAQLYASFGAGGILQTSKFDIAYFSWASGVDPDDSPLVMCDQFPPAGQNNFRYCNHDVDRQERLALATYDRAARKRAYDRIQADIAADVPFITLWFNRQVNVTSDDFKNFKPAHAVTPFWNTWEYSI